MVDREIIKSKLVFLEQTLVKLEELQSLKSKEFFKSFQNVDSAKYNLQVAIEAVIDIATHVVARERWGVPASSAEAIRFLAENNVITRDQSVRLMQMVKFRNRIVHIYQEVDDNQVYEILHQDLGDFRDFIRSVITKFLNEK
ncbi:MAG: type VII toxin-antitoxin system HepT family RNase toxin [Desulfitobacteriaceae bacterium]